MMRKTQLGFGKKRRRRKKREGQTRKEKETEITSGKGIPEEREETKRERTQPSKG